MLNFVSVEASFSYTLNKRSGLLTDLITSEKAWPGVVCNVLTMTRSVDSKLGMNLCISFFRNFYRLFLVLMSPFYLKTLQSKEENKIHDTKRTAMRKLKAKRLREYTMKSHSSMPPNNTYVNFERFAQVVEDLRGAERVLGSLATNYDSLQEDVEALISIYNEKETWYKEENENVRHSLSQLRYECRKVESMKKNLSHDVGFVQSNVRSVAGKYSDLESRYESLSKELSEDLKSIQDLMGGFQVGNAGYECRNFGAVFNRDISESFMNLLNGSCSEDLLERLNLINTDPRLQ